MHYVALPQDLMTQAAWNLCPVKIQYNSDCYYDTDQTFSQLSGEVHATFPDVPDGEWDLVVKRDMMRKIRGAVRDARALGYAAFWTKVFIAATAARAEQDYETSLLQVCVLA
jgi:aromatic ring hydroxylase